MNGGESRTVLLEILVTPNAKTVDYNFTIALFGHDKAEKELLLTLGSEYRLIFDPVWRYMMVAEPGEEIEYTAILRNIWDTSITNINFTLSSF